jgi:hypothetical protein
MKDARLPSARAMIGDWTVDRYQRLLSPQLVVSPVLFLAALFRLSNFLVLGLELIWFLLVGIQIGRHRGGRVEALVAGGMGGLLAGIAVALGRWLADPSARWGANVIAETLVTAIVGALLSAASFMVIRRLKYPPK